MMTFRKFTAIACAAILAGAFSSCNSLNDDDLGIKEQTATLTVAPEYTFTAVAAAGNTDEAWSVYPGASYAFKFDFKAQKCDITATDLKYLDDNTSTTFTLSNLPLSNEKYPSIVQGVNTPGPVAFQGADGQNHVVTDIRLFCMLDPYRLFDDNKQRNSVYLSFKIDGNIVKAIEYDQYFFGTTSTTDLASATQAPVTSTSARYRLQLKRKDANTSLAADLTILNPRFIPNMPVERMTFPDIPLTLTTDGYSLEAEKIIPTISGTPYPAFPITDLAASVVFENSFTLEFTCISPKGSYQVNADTTPYALRDN